MADRFAGRAEGARAVGVVLSWGALVAAALDAVENVALFRMLLRDTADVLGPIAFWCASAKFGLLGAGIAYALVGLLVSRERG